MKARSVNFRYVTYGTVVFIGMIYIMRAGSFILIPLVWAAFFSFALAPLTAWLENHRIPRLFAILLSLFLVTAIALLIMFLFVTQLASLLHDLPGAGTRLEEFLFDIRQRLDEVAGIGHLINSDVSNLVKNLDLSEVLRFTTITATTISLLPVFVFLFLYYQDFFREFITRLAPNSSFVDWLREGIMVVRKYITGMLMVTLIVSVLASLMFYFIGIKYYLLFGLFTAVCNLIPYVGVVLGSLITIVYVLVTTDQIWYPLMTLLLLWLLQVVENNLITPFVVGAKVKLNPLVVIIAIVTGGALWGVSGMILFIPLLGIVKIFFDKSASLRPYAYLLGDDIPIVEQKENFFIYLKKKYGKHSHA